MSLDGRAACWITTNVIRCVEPPKGLKPPSDCASADVIERALNTYLYETDIMPDNRREEMKRLLETNGRERKKIGNKYKTYIVRGSWPIFINPKTGKESTRKGVPGEFYTLRSHLRTVDVLAGSTSGAAAGPEVPAVVQEADATAAVAAVTALPVSTLPPIPNGPTSDPEHMSASKKARTRDVIWVQLVYVNEVMEVFLHRFNLDDAPRHLYDAIKNNLTNDVWRYNNVYEGDGLVGMEGLVIEDDAGDEQDYAGEQERAKQVFKYLAGKMDARNSSDPDEYPDTYKTKAPHDVCITMRSPN